MVSYLPLSHVAAQIYDLWTGLQWGAQVCFADPDALKVGVRSAHVGMWGCMPGPPTCVLEGPRVHLGVCISESFQLR